MWWHWTNIYIYIYIYIYISPQGHVVALDLQILTGNKKLIALRKEKESTVLCRKR